MSNVDLDNALNHYASAEPESDVDHFAPQFTTVGRFDIRYVRSAKTNAPSIVLLNGLPQSIRIWESFWQPLSEQFDLLAFDIPGFGLTKADESDMSPTASHGSQ